VLAVFCEDETAILHWRIYDTAAKFFPPEGDRYDFNPGSKLSEISNNLHVLPAVGHDVRLVENGKDGNPKASQHFHALLALAQSIEDLGLIVLDPMSRLYGQNENDNAAATFFVSLLEQLAQTTGASVILCHHTHKGASFGRNKQFDLHLALNQEAARGASAITGAVRWQCNLAQLPPREAKKLLKLDHLPKEGEYLPGGYAKRITGHRRACFSSIVARAAC
jgi:hypothetical protein